MQSQPQKWLVAGIASLGLSSTSVAFGQASEHGSLATPYGVISQGAPGFIPGPAGQFGASGAGIYGPVPGQPGQALTGAAPGALAPGKLGPGAGLDGTKMGGAGAPGCPPAGAPMAGAGAAAGAAGALAPGELGPGAGLGGTEMGGAGAPGGPAAGAPMAGAGAPAGAAGLPEGVLAGLGGEVGAGGAAFAAPAMIGDRGPLFTRANLLFSPTGKLISSGEPRPGCRSVAAIVPAVRGVKIADNQYPRPVDRVWVSFNYYDGVNSGLNSELRAPIKDMQVYNEIFGFEKTFLDQQASIGFRIPLNTLTITSSGLPGSSTTHTSAGNFSSFFKSVLWQDNRGNLISGGVDMSFPTGPTTFGGFLSTQGIKSFEFQPFLGYVFQRDQFYVQGFSSIAVPTDRNLATLYFFDIGLGYFVYRSQNPRALISAIVPVFETHLNIPLNWAGFKPQFLGSTPDVVDLTWGLNLGLASRAVVSVAYIHPVTGPAPFSGELALLLNVPFGGRPGQNIPLTPPSIGR